MLAVLVSTKNRIYIPDNSIDICVLYDQRVTRGAFERIRELKDQGKIAGYNFVWSIFHGHSYRKRLVLVEELVAGGGGHVLGRDGGGST